MDEFEPRPVADQAPDRERHWPDVRLVLKGLRARAGTPRPARDPRAVRSRGDSR